MYIHQAIIPAAGMGTRFLPFTKATPKELLPLLNKSAIEYIIKEGVDAGITTFYMITSGDKPTLAKYLQPAPALESAVAGKKGEQLLTSISSLIKQTRIEFVNQDKPLGLGHAVLMAKQQVGNTYFGVLLPDDIIVNAKAALAQLIEIAQTYKATVIAVQEVEPDQVSSYGIVAINTEIAPGLVEVSGLVEKPAMHDAPSRLAIIGRYVLSPRIFDALERTQAGSGGEIQLTDAIQHLLDSGERVLAYQVQGSRYDIGTPEGWLQANIELGLQVPEYAQAIKQMVKQV